MDYGMIGPALSLGLSGMGCCMGCSIAGMASHAVMSRVEEGHGKFIGMAAAPSSQMFYGILLMILMSRAIKDGTLAAASGIGIGAGAGLVFMLSAICQGQVAATGIQASAKQPAVFGKCFAALGIIESFALFAFVFALLLW